MMMMMMMDVGQVVQEYERAVIFRLGRLLNGGAKGPGEGQAKQGKPLTNWKKRLWRWDK